MSRYSSASSHTAGLRPSNRAGLCRFPSAGGRQCKAQGPPCLATARARLATGLTALAHQADGDFSDDSVKPKALQLGQWCHDANRPLQHLPVVAQLWARAQPHLHS